MGHTVTFYPGGTVVEVQDGETVLDAAVAAGVQVNSVCGGKGTCGKCLVIVDGPTGSETRKLSPEEHQLGYRLACQTTVRGDITVFIRGGTGQRASDTRRIPRSSGTGPNAAHGGDEARP